MLENEVVMHVQQWLEQHGHSVDSICINTQRGDDVAATLRDGSRFIVECKGSISRQGNELDCWHSAAMAVFGAIRDSEVMRPRDNHAIAFPDTELYRKTFEGLNDFLVRQKITLLWIQPDGQVRFAGAPNTSLERTHEG